MTSKKNTFQIKSNSGVGKKIYPKIPDLIVTHHVDTFPEIKPIQGIMPDSKEEYWIFLGLCKLKIEFIFQYQLFGGRAHKGGQVVDFWLQTVPLPTPLFVQGWYFHYGSATKAVKSRLNIMYLASRLRGYANKPVEVFDTELPTPDSAFYVLRKKLNISR